MQIFCDYRLPMALFIVISLLCAWFWCSGASSSSNHQSSPIPSYCAFVNPPPSSLDVYRGIPFTLRTTVTSSCQTVNIHPCNGTGQQYLLLQNYSLHTMDATYDDTLDSEQCIQFTAVGPNAVTEYEVIIRVQGNLGSVTNVSYQILNATYILLTWEQPYSLPNLTFRVKVTPENLPSTITSKNNVVVHVREGTTNITLTPYNDVGLGESLTTTVCIPKPVEVKSMNMFPSMCEDSGCIELSLLLAISPQVCPGTTVDLLVNVIDTNNGLTIGQLNDTVLLTINITVKVLVTYTAPSSKNLTINVVLTSVVGSLSFQIHSVSLSTHPPDVSYNTNNDNESTSEQPLTPTPTPTSPQTSPRIVITACVGLIITIIIVAVIGALICCLRKNFINHLRASSTNFLRASVGISAVNLNWIVTIPARSILGLFCSMNETNELRESTNTNDPMPDISQTPSPNAQQTAVCIEPPSCEDSPPLEKLSLSSPTTSSKQVRPTTLPLQSDPNDGDSSSEKTPSSPKSPTDSILSAQLHRLKQTLSTDNLVCLGKNISGSASSFLNKSMGKNSKNNATIDKEM